MTKSTSTPAGGNGAAPAIPDAADIEALWLDQSLGDGIVDAHYHSVPVGKPRDFFRTVADPSYRRRTEIYTHKVEGAIDARSLHHRARACAVRFRRRGRVTIVTVVYRDGSPRLWPIKFPRDGEHDNRGLDQRARGGQDRQWRSGSSWFGCSGRIRRATRSRVMRRIRTSPSCRL